MKWNFVKVTSGSFIREEVKDNFKIINETSCIHFNHKNYTIIKIEHCSDHVNYKAECIRHTGKKHIKYDTLFSVLTMYDGKISIGYCECIYTEA